MATRLHVLRERSERGSEARAVELPRNANWRDIGSALINEWMSASWEEEGLLQQQDEYWEELYVREFRAEPSSDYLDDDYESSFRSSLDDNGDRFDNYYYGCNYGLPPFDQIDNLYQ